MLVVYTVLLFLVGAAVIGGSAALFNYVASREFRNPRTILCPETLESAEVTVDAEWAARTALQGHQEFRLTDCSCWPERQGCDQACAQQVALLGDARSSSRYAPGGLPPRLLRVNNPVRMSRKLYAAVKGRAHLVEGK